MAILVNLACKTDCSPSPNDTISSFVGLLGSGISVPPGCLRSAAWCELPITLPSSGSERSQNLGDYIIFSPHVKKDVLKVVPCTSTNFLLFSYSLKY